MAKLGKLGWSSTVSNLGSLAGSLWPGESVVKNILTGLSSGKVLHLADRLSVFCIYLPRSSLLLFLSLSVYFIHFRDSHLLEFPSFFLLNLDLSVRCAWPCWQSTLNISQRTPCAPVRYQSFETSAPWKWRVLLSLCFSEDSELCILARITGVISICLRGIGSLIVWFTMCGKFRMLIYERKRFILSW